MKTISTLTIDLNTMVFDLDDYSRLKDLAIDIEDFILDNIDNIAEDDLIELIGMLYNDICAGNTYSKAVYYSTVDGIDDACYIAIE